MAVNSSKSPEIVLSWKGLPQYAARLMRAAIDRLDVDCAIVGSKPGVPVEGMEKALGRPVHWVNAEKPVSWQALDIGVPSIFVQSGWSYPAFSTLGREVKANGGRVIGLSDANWRGDFRQTALGPLGFRALHRNHFDAMIVPGEQGTQLMTYFGMPADKVRTGMYGADPTLFNGGKPLAIRSKTFLYVGQFISRKDVLGLTNAFLSFLQTHPDWSLHMCGSGEQHNDLPKHPNITVEGFVQPEQLAERYRTARFFILPSRIEAWGLVVHEAALCGCALALSDAIGSGNDLANAVNALRFQAGNEDAILGALTEAATFDDARLGAAEKESRRLASHFGPERFSLEVCRLVDQLRSEVRT